MRRRAGLALAAVVLILVSVLQGDVAAAHDPAYYFPPSHIAGLSSKWPFPAMNVSFTPSFPNSQVWRDRVQEAHANWPGSTGRPSVYFHITSSPWSASNPCAQGDDANGVFYSSLPIGTLGRTYRCDYYQHWNFNLVFNSSYGWHVGSGDPPSDFFDLESNATHEFGHAYGGWVLDRHFTGTTLCPSNDARHTMCSSLPIGTSYTRTPASHDVHTMDAGYP